MMQRDPGTPGLLKFHRWDRTDVDAIDVTVVIPTFHRERQVVEAIGSVLAQRGVRLELLVVDDSPEGSARGCVEAVGDPRLRYLARERPSGGRPARVRNDGARLARGRYLQFLDDDDILLPDALASMVAELDAWPEAGMAFGAIVPFGQDDADLRHHEEYFAGVRRIARRLRGRRALGAALVYRPAILVNSACMARRSAFEAAGGFDAEIPVCEDADLWTRISDASGFRFLDRPVVNYRTGAASLMHALSRDDARLHESYRRIQEKYRRRHGRLIAWMMKLHVRLFLR
jgi:GT2 family glycosyltransferase